MKKEAKFEYNNYDYLKATLKKVLIEMHLL